MKRLNGKCHIQRKMVALNFPKRDKFSFAKVSSKDIDETFLMMEQCCFCPCVLFVQRKSLTSLGLWCLLYDWNKFLGGGRNERERP